MGNANFGSEVVAIFQIFIHYIPLILNIILGLSFSVDPKLYLISPQVDGIFRGASLPNRPFYRREECPGIV